MRPVWRRFAALAVATLAVAAAVTASRLRPTVEADADFSVLNPAWNGASRLGEDLRRGGEVAAVYDGPGARGVTDAVKTRYASIGTPPERTSLMILGPEEALSEEDGAWLREFVAGGGRLMVADDHGTGNAFLKASGAASRFHGGPLRSAEHEKQPVFPSTRDLAEHPLLAGVDRVVLNHATALDVGGGARVLGRVGPASWVDVDGDGVAGDGEPRGPLPWLAVEAVGRGEVVALADPSVLVNGMRDVADDGRLAERVAAWLGEDGRTVVVDEKHRDAGGPIRFGARFLGVPEGWRTPLALAGFLLYAAAVAPAPRRTLGRLRERGQQLVARWGPPPDDGPAADAAAAPARSEVGRADAFPDPQEERR